jgi:hypothetical protein
MSFACSGWLRRFQECLAAGADGFENQTNRNAALIGCAQQLTGTHERLAGCHLQPRDFPCLIGFQKMNLF